MMCGVGALVTLELPADSPVQDLPWIVTIGPLSDDEDWDAVVCGPYERAHALAIAEELVADEQLMAVVEPVTPYVSVDVIRAEIEAARAVAIELAAQEEDDDSDSDSDFEEYDELGEADDDDDGDGDDEGEGEGDDEGEGEGEEEEAAEPAEHAEHTGPLTPEEIRAGVARVAARLLADNLTEG